MFVFFIGTNAPATGFCLDPLMTLIRSRGCICMQWQCTVKLHIAPVWCNTLCLVTWTFERKMCSERHSVVDNLNVHCGIWPNHAAKNSNICIGTEIGAMISCPFEWDQWQHIVAFPTSLVRGVGGDGFVWGVVSTQILRSTCTQCHFSLSRLQVPKWLGHVGWIV